METTLKNQLKVGMFLAAALAITLVSIFLLGGDSVFKKFIRIHSHFDQVQGLGPGSMVTLSGIRIGNVKAINFIPNENKLDVVMEIDEIFAERISEDSIVEVKTQGALGDKYVYIIPGSPTGNKVKEGSVLPVAASSDIMSVLGSRGSEAEKIFDIISELHKTAKAINQDGRVERIMMDLSSATASLKITADEARQLMGELRGENPASVAKAVTKLNSILEKVDKGQGSLGALINDPSLHSQLKSMLGGSDRKSVIKSLIRTTIDKNSDE